MPHRWETEDVPGNRKDTSQNIRIDTIPPMEAVVGTGDESPNRVWDSKLTTTYVHSVRDGEVRAAQSIYDPGSYAMVDLTGHVAIARHLTLRAGLFNITNHEYVIWNDLTSPGANTYSGSGIDSLTQPGRNYGVSLQYVF